MDFLIKFKFSFFHVKLRDSILIIFFLNQFNSFNKQIFYKEHFSLLQIFPRKQIKKLKQHMTHCFYAERKAENIVNKYVIDLFQEGRNSNIHKM